MPNKPKKIKRPWRPERVPFQRTRSDYDFYNGSRWRKVAALHKERHPLCIQCQADGLVIAAQVTDHIIRIKDGGDPYAAINLQSLCHRCHNAKSGREAHGFKAGKK